ncbi:MAG: AAA family ATPase [Cyanobacteria bacterium J06588_4]
MNDLAKLIARMQQPDFYPHAVNKNIELVQTHASLVFLTGDYAYKVKKSVDYGFLNYSTLAKRKHFIEEELRLNQKIAPDLYLAVVTISEVESELVLGSSGNIVEYALKMRQFSQANLFSNLLKTGKLPSDRFLNGASVPAFPKNLKAKDCESLMRETPQNQKLRSLSPSVHVDLCSELGKIVAQFHLSAKTSDRISSFGTVDKIQTAFTENYRQSQKYIGTVQTQEQFLATKAYSDNFFNRRQDLFKTRVEQDKIRECHGDLHLKNICLWQDKIQLFDRIEFNESFRFVDTIYDVAFIVMDLEARGKPELAITFLNSYLEYSGDWFGLLVLPLYLVRQAYVRAKVNSFLLDDPQISQAEQAEAKQTASDYYQQAYRYTQNKSGSLTMMSGLSGSGKSTVAASIARSKGAIQIRSDAVRKHLAEIPLDQSGSDKPFGMTSLRIYTPEMTQRTYRRLLELGIMLAKEGYTIILDAKYDRLSLRQPVITQAQANDIPLTIVHCTAPIEVLRDRLNKRQNDISDANANLIASQKANTEDFTTAEQAYVTTVDTSQVGWKKKLADIM